MSLDGSAAIGDYACPETDWMRNINLGILAGWCDVIAKCKMP